MVRQRWVVLLALVAVGVVVLTASASASGYDAGQIVALSSSPGCLGYLVETQAGEVTGCLPAPDANGLFTPASDGSVVFAASDNPSGGDQGSIWLARPNEPPVHLDDSVWDFDPSISYDGREVTFARFDPVTWSSDIYVVNSDGSGLRLVATGGGTNDLEHPTFSPDGGSIAYWCGPAKYATTPGPGCGPLLDGSQRSSGVMLMNSDGSNARMILIGAGSAAQPAGPDWLSWSPDGQWLTLDGCLVTSVSGGQTCISQVFAYRTDGSDLFNNADPSRQVTQEPSGVEAVFPEFCGNSTQILYLPGVKQAADEYLIDRDGTNNRGISLSPAGVNWGECIPPPTGKAPPPTVNATRVTVPRVRKLSYAAAKLRLEAAHMRVGRVHRQFARVPKNHVISQYPRAGAHAHRSTKQGPPESLVLSRGPRRS